MQTHKNLNGIQDLIEKKIRKYKDQLSLLKSSYAKEMDKHWRLRNKSSLVFLWKELSICECVIGELEEIRSQNEYI